MSRKVAQSVERASEKREAAGSTPALPAIASRANRIDRELEEWIDLELTFYVQGLINDGDYQILRRNLIRIAQAERRRR